jgi:pyruvate/2-oxoglutarate dehydrogenase complex dihydrolipoamide dehydrogenase (E3) component
MLEYQAIIIGTGQAGPALARRLAAAGWRIAVIERKLFGGTCHNTGVRYRRQTMQASSVVVFSAAKVCTGHSQTSTSGWPGARTSCLPKQPSIPAV